MTKVIRWKCISGLYEP